jgi:hypothetical protein
VETGRGTDGRRYAVWNDPFPKPCYLFALVAGELDELADSFVTAGGRKVELKVYVDPGMAARAAYAMDALKRSMRWDEEAFGREYDLDQLRSADLVLSYWMGPAIAHTLISFGFEDGRHVVFSLEIRKERGESFSALGGFFRKFEMTLVASEETDIIRTRTNARGEDVYLYRLHGMDRAQLKELFAAYIAQARELDAKPGFYNTLTSNCTTIVFDLARHIAPRLPLDYRLLLSGYLAEYAQEVGALAPGVPYAELHDKGRITQRALDLGDGPHFSTVIRQGVPGTEQDPQ